VQSRNRNVQSRNRNVQSRNSKVQNRKFHLVYRNLNKEKYKSLQHFKTCIVIELDK